MLYAAVAKCPAGQHDAALEYDEPLHLPSAKGRLGQQGNEYHGAEERVEKEHGNHCVGAQSMLLAHIIKAQKGGAKECKC